jgi:hypothetical protein
MARRAASGVQVVLVLINALVFVVITLPALLVAASCYAGRFTDTSVEENRQFGLVVLLVFVAPALLLNIALGIITVFVNPRRRRKSLCPRCGYDLRGAPGGGCPECGWRGEAAENEAKAQAR